MRRVRVGAAPDAGCVPPARVDPVIAAEASRMLTVFLARGAQYGAIEYEVINGVRYAFRFSKHPADAGIAVPHPGVDYLVCGPVTAPPSQELSLRGGLPALAIVGVAFLVLAGAGKR
jgi:hypothetical protein